MATFKIGNGIDRYITQLEELATSSEGDIKQAVYVGAGIVTNAVRKNIQSLPVRSGGFYEQGHMATGITSAQKSGLLEGLGIAPFRDDRGYIHVKVGMDGYNRTRTEKYPMGQPNALIARSVEAGTYWLRAHPFVDPAVRATRAQAEAAMAAKFDELCKKHMT